MKRIKIISIMLCSAMAVSVLAGCGKKPTPPSSAVIISTPAETSEITTATSETTTELAPSFAPTEETEETTVSYTTESTTEETTTEATPTPKPTNTPAPTPSVKLESHVKDEANVIKDDAALEAKLAEFEKATKIIPVVYTVKSNLTGDEFRTYAKNIYKNNYSDQNHFLIVYRVAKSGGGWSWTTSIGSKAYTKLKNAGLSSSYSSEISTALKNNKDRGKAFIAFFDKAQKAITGKE